MSPHISQYLPRHNHKQIATRTLCRGKVKQQLPGCLFAEGGTKDCRRSRRADMHHGNFLSRLVARHQLQEIFLHLPRTVHLAALVDAAISTSHAFGEGDCEAGPLSRTSLTVEAANLSSSLRHAYSACRQLTKPPSRPLRQLSNLLASCPFCPLHVLDLSRRRPVHC